jgi:hypothetical protein
MRSMRNRLVFFLLFSFFALGECTSLWVFEEDFIKLGKKGTYEKYSKEFHGGFVKQYPCNFYAYRNLEDAQCIYLTPIEGFTELGAFLMQSDSYMRKLPPQKFLAFASSINFSIRTLRCLIQPCSFIPPDKGDIMDFPYANFRILTLPLLNANDLEAHLNNLAQKQKNKGDGVSFRTWKEILGGELPTYVIGVFGQSENELDLFDPLTPELKKVISKQYVQKTALRKLLTFVQ